MGTWITLLLAVPFVGWLAAVVVGTQRRERRRLEALESGARAHGWTYTAHASEIRPRPPKLREWHRRIRFLEGFAGRQDGQEFAVAHIVHESTDPESPGRRTHATICWIRMPFPLNEVRIVPVELAEERRRLVGGELHSTGEPDFDARYRILTGDELLGRMAAGPVVRSLLLAHQRPWSVTLQGVTLVAERADRVPRNVEDGMNGVAIAMAVARALTGRGRLR
ncbi:hypothetical protein GA0111570_103192 [Raineyella antarctica]|uniref:DUF3137 domain-containing protein n=1 Tax=Raineyella antarctica TaxID=1577474 RepID=A0A1G6GGC0_9ACTN|nr:hypothetical protein [Raineyella antarctica]SDB81010.1 hypothetical protein GA0111570_103192 [Raineyella antarctica]